MTDDDTAREAGKVITGIFGFYNRGVVLLHKTGDSHS